LGTNVQYELVEKAMHYLRERSSNNPSLTELANFLGVGECHVQRTFKQWAGVSPEQYLRHLITNDDMPIISNSESTVDFSRPLEVASRSRLHEIVVKTTALSPAEVKSKGNSALLSYGFSHSPLGTILIGWTDRGICWLSFVKSKPEDFIELQEFWSNGSLVSDEIGADKLSKSIFGRKKYEISVVLSGTNFQMKVWEALACTMPNEMITYSDLAIKAGKDRAYRAVATAVGKNKIAYLIPCHRVIPAHGNIGAYRWGKNIKQKLFLWDKA